MGLCTNVFTDYRVVWKGRVMQKEVLRARDLDPHTPPPQVSWATEGMSRARRPECQVMCVLGFPVGHPAHSWLRISSTGHPNTPKPRDLEGGDQAETPTPTPCCYSMVIPDLKFKNSGLQLGVAREAESLNA